ncbi:hypothetical protein EDB85DRAFT_1893488 [Lactarius pseudohatsudake]|nr:hypothetical protein EDB85DRAFT_1893488 [Lactarius pseudohatsudake]
MALLIVSTGQFAIDLGKCTILTGGARKYRQYNIIREQLRIYPNPVISSPGFSRTEYFGHLNALLGLLDFEPETTLVLVLSARVDAGACFPSTRRRRRSIAASRHHRITPPSLLLNRFQMTLFKFARKLLRALLKAVWRGLKRAIGPLVTRINGMGWRIRMDLKVHLNVATGSGDVVDRSFGPIRFEFSRGIEAIPSVEGADQV